MQFANNFNTNLYESRGDEVNIGRFQVVRINRLGIMRIDQEYLLQGLCELIRTVESDAEFVSESHSSLLQSRKKCISEPARRSFHKNILVFPRISEINSIRRLSQPI